MQILRHPCTLLRGILVHRFHRDRVTSLQPSPRFHHSLRIVTKGKSHQVFNQLLVLFIGERVRAAVPVATMARAISEQTQFLSEQLERPVGGGSLLILIGLKSIVRKLPQNEFAAYRSSSHRRLSRGLLKFVHASPHLGSP
jgi:hypothetical protein